MIDNILEELNNKYLYKHFKYYGINGLCDWIDTIIEVGYTTRYIKHRDTEVDIFIKSSIGITYYLNEILILDSTDICYSMKVIEKWRENNSGHRTDISQEEREKQKDGYYNLYTAMRQVKEENK